MRQYSQVKGPLCIPGCTPNPPQEKKKGQVWQRRRDAAGSFYWLWTTTITQVKKFGIKNLSYFLLPASLDFIIWKLKQSQQLDTFWTDSNFNCLTLVLWAGWKCVCECLCAWFVFLSWKRNARETPNHPVCHLVPYLTHFCLPCHLSLSPLSLVLPSGLCEQTSDRSTQTTQH